MANNYVDNKTYWDDLSDLDYISAFVKAWLAFNAWYRSHYNLSTDREILDQIKFVPNPIKNRAETMLKTSGSDKQKRFKPDQDALELRSEIALLHDRLEKHPLTPFDKKRSTYKKITMTNVFLKRRTPAVQSTSYSGLTYEVIPILSGTQIQRITVKVSRANGSQVRFLHTQTKFDENDLTSQPNFATSLNPNQIGRLLALYREINP
ncbi:hypothetical protein [Deinococcus multiflagellatus]|uniref:Transposase n=1 Tax=Deinococcus multiflagellatus TaxID=1656887 RepID=A0ABW1ZMY4_9DEIO|nr:hypothetical protein [Deinococcus multiflagellatus]MBZ9716074.1 hypothetical protein [Deinococcus multiflagellatus]